MTQRIVPSLVIAFLAVASTLMAGAADARQPDLRPARSSPQPAIKEGGVNISPRDGKLVIEIGGRPFAEYHYQDATKPYLYPVLGPDGEGMTRNWPMKNVPGEEHDHPHHRSLWYAHGNINGQDFWSESPQAGRTVHQEFELIQSGPEVGIIKSVNKLVGHDGKVVATDERTYRFYNRTNQRLFDFEITIRATETALTFGDTKEGTMAMRVAESMRLTGPRGRRGQGHIVNSEGVRDGATWGKRAKWCDYYGPVDGKIVGVAIFDNPSNPRFPTWWHVRDYGLFAANPFGIHDFERKPAGTGNLTVPFGSSITFRYRFYIHDGDTQQADVAGQYARYVAETAGKDGKPNK
jgi:Family of unknown function (DUF6807)